ncbi:uncharacterized protein LOC125682224 [Ostrea edulis]|uniref:uncharacterized protein LOC125682224 n=1 Tax=Ostrea edulis TaxID=37623 RepID=UPI0024AF9700|nr:uncharacterized protein LOC125682224 [Ostrea edulis]XP_048778645.2 uncharacterized protein LOC125682224 [Ostrea edulis]
MVTTIYDSFLVYVLLTAWIAAVNRISSQEVPSHLKDKNWQLKSDEGDGSVYFYASSIVLQPTVSVGGVQIPTWNLVATKTNFLAFRSPNTVSIDSEDKYIYKCWLYKQQNESLFYYFPMTGVFEGQRVYLSIDGNLDICDFCTDINSELYTLHQETVPCGCTPLCSELTIQNTCTGTHYDTSSTNCLSELSTSVSVSTTTEETSTQQSSETRSLITSPASETSTTIMTSTASETPTTIMTSTVSDTSTALMTSTASANDLLTSVTVATTNESVESTDGITTENAQGTTISGNKDIPASEKLGMDPDDLLWVVSGSVMFIYLAAAMVGCGCCLILLGRRRKQKKKDKESQESLVPGKRTFQNNFNILSGLPSVFYRIDE